MKLPRFTNTLHFRISAMFMLLLAVSGVALWLWIGDVLKLDWSSEEEEIWFLERAPVELDSLATLLSAARFDTSRLRALVVTYGREIDRFNAEVVVFDAAGNNLTSSKPDSLGFMVPTFDPSLLLDMSSGTWDFTSYPIEANQDAYGNRLFQVRRLYAVPGTEGPVTGFLAASFRPANISPEEIGMVDRTILIQAAVLALVYAALSGLIILTWTSRRIRRLSEDVEAFAAGNLSHRVAPGSSDEIGSLGNSFNDMARRLQEMVEQLRQKEKFQRRLIANVSHDLRTPLASMKGYLETVQANCRDCHDGEPVKYLNIIASNLEYLDRLIERMLVLSRFDTGQAVFQMEDFPLAELCDTVLLRCQGLADRHAVALHLDCPPDLPLVHADPLQIDQVLQNLVENGIKFNKPGGAVFIRLNHHEAGVQVRVEDTGIGIATEDLPHIFERFFTGDRSRSRRQAQQANLAVKETLGQNSGLGLAIAAKIVARHDSWLKVETELGKGTTFRFTLAAASGDVPPVPGP